MATVDSTESFEAIPPLRGILRRDDEARTIYGRDLGNIVHERPRAVLSPGSVDDIATIVKFARRHGLRIAARGAGHQPFGQAQVKDGIVIDLRSLHEIHTVTGEHVDTDAGTEWRAVLAATLQRGKTPPVLPNYLPLTVGGTLSIGGIGVSTFRYGTQADHVRELEVVTGTGDVLRCSESRHPDLFRAALVGQGQCAIITRAHLQLVAAGSTIREYLAPYRELAPLLDVQRKLAECSRADGLAGLLLRGPQAWSYALQAIWQITPPKPPDDTEITSELGGSAQMRDVAYEEYMNTSPYVETPGAHADLGLLLPAAAAASFLEETVPRLTARDLGEAMAIRVFAWNRSVFGQPLFRLPDADSCVYIALLRAPMTDPTAQARAVAGNRTLFDRVVQLGGTLYPYAALELTRSDWRRHYAGEWSSLMTAKRRYDPSDVFASGPDLGLDASTRSGSHRGTAVGAEDDRTTQ